MYGAPWYLHSILFSKTFHLCDIICAYNSFVTVTLYTCYLCFVTNLMKQ